MNSKLILNILCILSFYNLQASDKKPWNFVDISKACETAIKHLNNINQQLDSDGINDKNFYKIISNSLSQSY